MSHSSISFRHTQRLNPGQNQGPPALGTQLPAVGGSRQEYAPYLNVGDRVLREDNMAERQWVDLLLMNLAEQKIQLEESAKKARLRRNLMIALGIALSPVVGAVTAMGLTAI
jgi:hypothetical protein